MFEIAMNDQMQIATNQLTANTGLCGSASCGNRVMPVPPPGQPVRECVNLDNNAMVNGDYLFIEGAFSPDRTPGAAAGGKETTPLGLHTNSGYLLKIFQRAEG